MLEISNDVNLVNKIKMMKIKNVIASIVTLGIPSFLVLVMFGLLIAQIAFGLSNASVIVATLNLFVQSNLWYGRHYKKKLKEALKEFSDEIYEKTDIRCHIDSVSDLEIVPKNIRLGSDLSHNNIVEVFKKGHYVLVHTYPKTFVIRQYKDEEERLHVDLLDGDEEKNALDDVNRDDSNDEVKRLTLWKKD